MASSWVTPLLVLATACGGGTEGTWVVELDGSDAWLAVVVADDRAVAYVCGGPESLTTHTRWFGGELDGDAVTFETDGWTLTAQRDVIDHGVLDGLLIAPSEVAVSFESRASVTTPLAGLFTAVLDGCRAGVILQSDGDAAGARSRGAFCDDRGQVVAQVTPVLPIAQTAAGIPVVADTANGVREFFVSPAEPAAITELDGP